VCEYTFTNEDGSALSYLSVISVNFECSVCGTKSVLETIDAIFVNLGYSVEENTTEGAVAHKVKVNREALARYEELTGKSLKFGVIAGIADDEQAGNIIDASGEKLVALGNSLLAEFSNTEYSIVLVFTLSNLSSDTSVVLSVSFATMDDCAIAKVVDAIALDFILLTVPQAVINEKTTTTQQREMIFLNDIIIAP
jgi:hypothetical protein